MEAENSEQVNIILKDYLNVNSSRKICIDADRFRLLESFAD